MFINSATYLNTCSFKARQYASQLWRRSHRPSSANIRTMCSKEPAHVAFVCCYGAFLQHRHVCNKIAFFVIRFKRAHQFYQEMQPAWYTSPWITTTFLGAFAELRKATISFVMSVRPRGTTRLPLDGFWLNLLLELFSKICRQNSSFIKIRQE